MKKESIYDLAKDRPLKTVEIYEPNDFYGHATNLKKYANLSQSYQIKAAIEHGAGLGGNIWEQDIINPLPCIFTSSTYRAELLKRKTEKKVFVIGPNILYADAILKEQDLAYERQRLGTNILSFPAHSTHHVDAHYDISKYCEILKKLAKDYQTTRVCLYWKDILRGVHKAYQDHGFEVVTAGHIYDPSFLLRLKSIIDTATLTTSNSVGTHIGYCIMLGKPHLLTELEVRRTSEKQERLNECADYNEKLDVIEIRNNFTTLKTDITAKQKEIVNKYWGFSEFRSKEELASIITESEQRYQRRKSLGGRTRKIQDSGCLFEGNFDEVLRNIAPILKSYPRRKKGKLKIDNKELYFVDLHSFYHQAIQIFNSNLYGFISNNANPTIIDCGAHIGLASIYFAQKYPLGKIYAYEADPNIVGILKKNIKSFGLNNVEVLPKAVWINDSGVLFSSTNDDSGCIHQKNDANCLHVPSIRLKEQLEGREIDLLKIDIEGAEYDVITDCEDFLSNAKNIIIEVHKFRENNASFARILQALEDNNFQYTLGDFHPADWLKIEKRAPFDAVISDQYIVTIFAWQEKKTTSSIKSVNEVQQFDHIKNFSDKKIVHLCVQDFGGAGKAAYRLHKGLQKMGVTSTMLVLNKKSKDPTVKIIHNKFIDPSIQNSDTADYESPLWLRQVLRWQTGLEIYPNRPAGLEMFTDALSDIQLETIPEVMEADIINLHWVAGLLDYANAPLLLRDKQIVWTLHDMNPFTGGCHYSGNCTKYRSSCGACPQLGSANEEDLSRQIWNQKNYFFNNLNVHVVTPSEWLAKCVSHSTLLSEKPVEVIPNGFPLDIFLPKEKTKARQMLNLPKNAKVILFGADSVVNARKGFVYLLGALNKMASKKDGDVVILTFGNLPEGIKIDTTYTLHSLGSITDENKLAYAYSAADVFVIPSLEDNLPNTVIEAMSCGVPVVGFEIGGIPDMIEHKKNGFIAKPKDISSLLEGIDWALSLSDEGIDVSTFCRDYAENKFSQKIQAEAYKKLYTTLMTPVNSPSATNTVITRDCGDTLQQLELIYRQALSSAENGKFDEAIEILEKLILKNPAYAKAHNDLGVLYCEKGEFIQAQRHYEKAIGLDPDNVTFKKNYAEFNYVIIGKVDKALEIYINLLQAHPIDIEVLLSVGKICIDIKKYDDAEVFFSRVRELDPANAHAISHLQQIARNKNDQDHHRDVFCPLKRNDKTTEDWLVSAIVSTYNSELYLRGCLEDLVSQTIADRVEIIVVDSGSKQNEAAIVREFQAQYNNIQYIRTDVRETVYAAWNRGIRAASGKYVTNANTDDRHRSDAYEVMVDKLEKNPEVALVYANCIITETPNETFENCTPVGLYRWLDWNRDDLLHKGCFMGPHPMWRRSLHEEYGYFDESFVSSGDYEFWLRISQTHRFFHISETLGLYLKTPTSIEHSNRHKQALENQKILDMYREANRDGRIIRRTEQETNKKQMSGQFSVSPLDSKHDSVESLTDHNIHRFPHTDPIPSNDVAEKEYLEAQSMMVAGDRQATLKRLEELVRSHPSFGKAFNDLGVLYANTDHKEKALAYYERAVRLQPDNIIFRKNFADFLCLRLGRVEDAVKNYVAVLDAQPNDVEALMSMAIICLARDFHEDAQYFLGRVLEIDPGNSIAQQKLAQLNEKIYTELNNKWAEDDYQRMKSEFAHKRVEDMIPHLEAWKATHSTHPGVYNDLGTIYHLIGDNEKALSNIQNAVELDPNNSNFRNDMADYLLTEMNDVDAALEAYHELLELRSNDIATLMKIGHLYAARKDFVEAEKYYKRVLDIDPDHQEALNFHKAIWNRRHSKDTAPPTEDHLCGSSDPVLSREAGDLSNLTETGQGGETSVLTSIIVVLDGTQNRIKRCISSIENHTQHSYELILVCNSAGKGVKKWAKNLADKHEHIHRLLLDKKVALATALNRACQDAKGQRIVILHSDVIVGQDWLSALLECVDHDENVGVVGPMANKVEGRQQSGCEREVNAGSAEEYAREYGKKFIHRRIPVDEVTGFCLVFKPDLIEQIGPFDTNYQSERYLIKDLCRRASLKGFQNYIAGGVYLYHADKHGSSNQLKANDHNRENDRAVFNAKWNGFDIDGPVRQAIEVKDLIDKGHRLFRQEQVKAAVDVFIQAIGMYPQNDRLYIELANELKNYGKFQQALDTLSECPNIDADAMNKNINVITLKGYCEEGLGNDRQAEVYANQALKHDSSYAPALNLKGILAFKKGNVEAAQALFQQAIDADHGFGEAYTNLGAIYWEQGEKEKAFEWLQRGFVLNPLDLEITNLFHTALTELNKFDIAENIVRDIAAIYEDSKRLQYLLIDIFIQQNKYPDAIRVIENAIAEFGYDDGIGQAALKIRQMVGPMAIDNQNKGKPTVSLCMIVKNEEKDLARCLASIKPIVDEMVIVDTGSTDKTKDIAVAFGAKVYDHEWKEDFAAARNQSLSKATGDWVLIMDADEVISPRDYRAFRRLVAHRTKRPMAYSITTRNYNTESNIIGWMPNSGQYKSEEAGSGWLPSFKVRLFTRTAGIRFEGAVHEMVDGVLKRKNIKPRQCSIPVHHYGRLDKTVLNRKGNIYYEIGRKKLAELGDNVEALRELAVQATILEKNEEALALWQKLLAHNINPMIKAHAFINMGTLYSRMGQFEESLKVSQQAQMAAPQMKEANYNLAMAELHLGNAEKAVSILESLLEKQPDYPPAQFVLITAYLCNGQKQEGLEGLKRLQNSAMGHALVFSVIELAKSLIAADRRAYALRLLETAFAAGIGNRELVHLLNLCNGQMNSKQAVA